MKSSVLAAMFALALPASLAAQTAPTPVARFTLDTPVQEIAADPKGKAVLDKDLPTLTSHPMYESFKALSLRQLQQYAPDRMTDAVLARIAADLSAVK